MENYNEPQELFNFGIDVRARELWKSIAGWAMIIVIATAVGWVFDIIKAVLVSGKIRQYEGFGASSRIAGAGIGSVIFGIVLGLVMMFFLYQFASLTKKGLANMNQDELNRGFGNLKVYFVIIGVLLIICLAIFLIALLAVSAFRGS
jgi:hypothetical protein